MRKDYWDNVLRLPDPDSPITNFRRCDDFSAYVDDWVMDMGKRKSFREVQTVMAYLCKDLYPECVDPHVGRAACGLIDKLLDTFGAVTSVLDPDKINSRAKRRLAHRERDIMSRRPLPKTQDVRRTRVVRLSGKVAVQCIRFEDESRKRSAYLNHQGVHHTLRLD